MKKDYCLDSLLKLLKTKIKFRKLEGNSQKPVVTLFPRNFKLELRLGKTKKKKKSGDFEKTSDLVFLNFKINYFPKPSNGKKSSKIRQKFS